MNQADRATIREYLERELEDAAAKAVAARAEHRKYIRSSKAMWADPKANELWEDVAKYGQRRRVIRDLLASLVAAE